jgi:hypothetical protein
MLLSVYGMFAGRTNASCGPHAVRGRVFETNEIDRGRQIVRGIDKERQKIT